MHQGCILNLIKTVVYLAMLPFRLLYFLYRWTVDQVLRPVYLAWCTFAGKQTNIKSENNTFPFCCLSCPCCKTCCPCCAYENVCLCLQEDSLEQCTNECWLEIDLCCLQNCTFLGCGSHCIQCSQCCQWCAMCMLQCVVSVCSIFGEWWADCMESYCRRMCECMTCLYEIIDKQ